MGSRKFIISNFFKDKRGHGNYIWTVVFIFFFTFLICALIEILVWFTVCMRIKEAMTQSALSCLTEQYDEMFAGGRDKYSGAYTTDTNYSNIDIQSIYDDLNFILNCVDNEKEDKNGNLLYKFHDLSCYIDNTGLRNDSKNLNINLSLFVDIPIKFFNSTFTPSFKLSSKATFKEKY